MADLVIACRHDMPARVAVRRDSRGATCETPLRFTEILDLSALHVGAGGSGTCRRSYRGGDARRLPTFRARQQAKRSGSRFLYTEIKRLRGSSGLTDAGMTPGRDRRDASSIH